MEKDTLFSYGYLGAGAGIPAGLSSFTSFGRYHSNIGYGATIYGGYRFNSMFSVEMSLFSGHMNLFTTPCCSFYWMGSDGERYKRPLTSAESYSYKDILSSVFLLQSDWKCNINLLPFIFPRKAMKWQLFISPSLSLVNTKATVKPVEIDKTLLRDNLTARFGAGIGAGIAYTVSPQLDVRFDGGFTWVAGDSYDLVKSCDYHQNMIFTASIGVVWKFRRSKSLTARNPGFATVKRKQKISENANINKNDNISYAKQFKSIDSESSVSLNALAVDTTTTNLLTSKDSSNFVSQIKKMQLDDPQMAKLPETIQLCSDSSDSQLIQSSSAVYFKFNQTTIQSSQNEVVATIAKQLMQYPEKSVLLTGYADSSGGVEINNYISLARAKSIKQALEALGVAPSQIFVTGAGIDSVTSAGKARRVEIQFLLQSNQLQYIDSVYFRFNETTIQFVPDHVIRIICQNMTTHPKCILLLEGFTDAIGSENINQHISIRRAEAVKQYLMLCGIPSNRMCVKAGGINKKSKPADKLRCVTITLFNNS